MRRALEPALGRVIAEVEVIDPKLSGAAALRGRRVEATWRRGKTLGIDAGAVGATLHPRMTGRLLWRAPGAPMPGRLRLRFEGLDDALWLHDPRRLAVVQLGPRAALEAPLEALGPEPWPEPLGAGDLSARFVGDRRAIKVALLDQARVAGVGNIGATEACWRASIDPRRSASALDAADWAALGAGLFAWVDAALGALGEGELELLHAGGPNPFLAYARGGLPCARCGAPLLSERQGGRSTVRCPACQV